MQGECVDCGGGPIEVNDRCASCNHAFRKSERILQANLERSIEKQQKAKAFGKSPARPNTFECSDGKRVSQSQIVSYYLQARINKYKGAIKHTCEACGGMSEGSAHIIAQARCKVIHKTELIWDPGNFFPACHKCNAAIENPKGEGWKALRNVDKCLLFIAMHDPELLAKFRANSDIEPNS